MKNRIENLQHRIPAQECRAEILVVNSRFIAIVSPAFSVEEARNVIERIRQEFPDATHHVPAYLIGCGSTVIEHCHDDGEPAGTAGRPILNVLKGSGVCNIVLVVVRYFGGTKLGSGGLVRAYQQAAKAVLEKMPLAVQIKACELECQFDYSNYQKIMRVLENHQGKELKTEFSEQVTLNLVIPLDHRADFEQEVTDLTRGRLTIRVIKPEVFIFLPA